MQLQQNHNGFEQLLRELVLRMSPKVLLNTTQVPLECPWQDQFSQSFRTISSSVNLKMSVGSEFGQRAFLDLYIDGFQWGVELIREGQGKRLEEHEGRFRRPDDGRYHGIPMQQYALLNSTSKIPTPAVLNMYDNHVYHLVYNDTYTKVTVYQKEGAITDWDLIGHQGRTEH